MLEINETKDLKQWNDFLLKNQGSFLQSFEWGEFQKSLGKKIWRWQIREGDKVLAAVGVIKETFPVMGRSLFYIPFGPVFKKEATPREEIISLIVKAIARLAEEEKAILLKIEPLDNLSDNLLADITIGDHAYPLIKNPQRLQPQKTLILDLRRKENEIFENFKYRVRYNIRLSRKKGVVVKTGNHYSDEFYRLMVQTAERDGFRCFPEEYYRKLFQIQSDVFKVDLAAAYYQGTMIAANILVFFNEQALCLHGASDSRYRALKAPNLLQWEEIKLAQRHNCQYYDFWGIDEEKWPGLTYFKKTFGGQVLTYPSSVDIVLNPFWHRCYQIVKKLKAHLK